MVSFASSPVHSSLTAGQVIKIKDGIGFSAEDCADLADLSKIGIGFDPAAMRQLATFSMDALQSTVTTGSIGTPLQFLQTWLPGFVNVITRLRNIDSLVGITTLGNFEDEEVVQGILEQTGKAQPYGDVNNVPFSSWNTNFERRTVVRFEEGLQVGRLEDMRASRMRVNSAESKRGAAALALEIQRNYVGFYGFNSGNGRTYGFLNDPNLPNYVNVAATGTGSTTTWSTKTFLNICADIRTAVSALRTRSGANIDPMKTATVLAIASASVDYLATVSDYGISVRQWIKETYPQMRIENAPELDSANGGANVFYLYAETVADTGTDDQNVWVQAVPMRSMLLGVHPTAKGYVEDYANATAGVMLKRPYAVVRYSGV